MNPEPMSIRRIITEEILDTIFFGNLDNIIGARGRKFSKVKTKEKDAYMIPFGHSKNFFGAVLVHSPKKIQIITKISGIKKKITFKSSYETKSYLCKKMISQ